MLKQIPNKLNDRLSLYIHWPFCISKCPYCDFNSHVYKEVDYQVWKNAYIKELSHFKNLLSKRTVDTIFFGGGTPSLMHPKIVDSIVSEISKHYNLSSNVEITLEANPTSVESSKFEDFKQAGINRVSIGVQSFNDDELKFLGRQHDAKDSIAAIKLAEKYFTNYSFDLIYALPNQTKIYVRKTVEEVLNFAASHISLYQLTIEKGTKFYSMYNKRQFSLPSNDLSGDMYDIVNNMLMENGFDRYEISNYATPGYECRHNLCYWNYEEYLGIGPGSHSRLWHNSLYKSGIMSDNNLANLEDHLGPKNPYASENFMYAMHMTYNPQKWLEQVERNNNGINEQNILSKQELFYEIIMMGLRSKYGVSKNKIRYWFGAEIKDLLDKKNFLLMMDEGLLVDDQDYVKLTDKGMNVHSYVLQKILL